jgi:colicin import membrane protein
MRRFQPYELASEWGPDFTRGVGVSAILHLAVAALIVWAASLAPAPPPPLASYTVELTDPAALGGRLAFGPLDRPLGRPRRIAEPAGGAPAGAPAPGEPAPAETTKPAKGAEAPKAVAPPKVAEAPKPVEPAKPADESVTAVAPPKPAEAPKPEEAPRAPTPVEPPKPLAAEKPPEPEVSLSQKTEPQEQPKPPPEPTPQPKVEPKPEPAPAPRAEPAPQATNVPTTVPTPTTVAPPAAAPEPPPPPGAKEAPQAKVGTPGPVTTHPVPAPPKTAAPRSDAPPKTAARKPEGVPDGARIVPAKPLAPLPRPDAGAVAKPAPDVAARGAGGAGSGGSAEAPAHDDYAAAAERWRSRMAGGMGGMDGAADQQGPVGDGTNAAGGGGTVVGFEFLSYRQRIFGLIKRNWANAIRRPGLVAAVRFEIAPDGTISGVQLVSSSGDKAYDQSVVRAVQRSSPLPPPPERYREDFREMLIDFHSEEEGGQGTG